MKSASKWISSVAFCLMVSVAIAQVPEDVTVNNNDAFPDFTKMGSSSSTPSSSKPSSTSPTTTSKPSTSSSSSNNSGKEQLEKVESASDLPADADAPLDGIVERKTIVDKQVLPWENIREADIMWSQVVWRVIDVREKINQPFTYPEEYFFSILLSGIKDSTIRAYKGDNDKFKYRITGQDLQSIISKVDTITTIDPNTYETKNKIVFNVINPEDIKRYRVKEMWYFDKQQSVLKVRILGIAPLKDVKNEAGEFLFEMPLFWVYYPNCREHLGKHRAFIEGNDSNPMSWEDMMELRRFSSYVWKSSNVQNRKLQDYLQGVDILLEGEKIKQDIFNFEHDLWSY
jgi:gliding motility associated protien GldN